MQSQSFKRTASIVHPVENKDSPVDKRNPRTQFTEQILKKVVGPTRANAALQSISMQYIPGAIPSGLNFTSLKLQKVRSDTEMDPQLSSQLISVNLDQKPPFKKEKSREHTKDGKEDPGKKGVAKYICEDSESDDDSHDGIFENADEEDELHVKNLMTKMDDPSPLIDGELINLLTFCTELYEQFKNNNEDYQEEIMLKSIELGKKNRQKLLILDMDETMISARYRHKMPIGFVTDFEIDFQGQPIHVRKRPYLADCLERLSSLYEIVVFTAGIQEYADKILDDIDPERSIIKKRLYRQDCIQVQEFFIKDLDVFIDREKENIIIVDNSILSFAFDIDNGVPIQSFMGTEEDDKELLYLMSFLEEAFYQQDVRQSVREAFKLSQLKSTFTDETQANAL